MHKIKIALNVGKHLSIFSIVVIVFCFGSCKKNWIDVKSDKSLVVPSTISDFQALLDRIDVFNRLCSPFLSEIGTDNAYYDYSVWQALIPAVKNSYIWNEDIFEGNTGISISDWTAPYQAVFTSNVVLEGVSTISPTETSRSDWNNIKGSALFYRAIAFFNLAQQFAKPYNKGTAISDMGIPIRLNSDLNIVSTRATVQETYDQIAADLLASLDLLPSTPSFVTRPSKAASLALLAKTYLVMQDYNNALKYSDLSLKIKDTLISYENLSSALPFPFPQFNSETIFWCTVPSYNGLQGPRLQVDSNLYKLYDSSDLRKSLYFTNASTRNFKGSYDGSSQFFSGIATDEVYLIRAECYARAGNLLAAMADLNKLLRRRWKSTLFKDMVATNADDALSKVIDERRKELVFREIRWSDLRRLNNDPKFSKSVSRILSGQLYTLLPNSPKYVFPIPIQEVQLSGISQNSR